MRNNKLFLIFILFTISAILHNCENIPEKNDFFTKEEYINLCSIFHFKPVPIYNKLIKYDIETINKNISSGMRYSRNMINKRLSLKEPDSRFLFAYIRLFYFKTLFNNGNFDINEDLPNLNKTTDIDTLILFRTTIKSTLSKLYTGNLFNLANCDFYYIFENEFNNIKKIATDYDYNAISEKLAKKVINKYPNLIEPYFHLVHLYASQGECHKVKTNFVEIDRILSSDSLSAFGYDEQDLKDYSKGLKDYISQFCDMENLKN